MDVVEWLFSWKRKTRYNLCRRGLSQSWTSVQILWPNPTRPIKIVSIDPTWPDPTHFGTNSQLAKSPMFISGQWTQPDPSKEQKIGPDPTKPNPSHGWTNPCTTLDYPPPNRLNINVLLNSISFYDFRCFDVLVIAVKYVTYKSVTDAFVLSMTSKTVLWSYRRQRHIWCI